MILDCTPAYIATSIEARDENNTLTEYRYIDENVEIVDNTTVENENKQEEQRELPPIDYSVVEQEIELIKLKQIRH